MNKTNIPIEAFSKDELLQGAMVIKEIRDNFYNYSYARLPLRLDPYTKNDYFWVLGDELMFTDDGYAEYVNNNGGVKSLIEVGLKFLQQTGIAASYKYYPPTGTQQKLDVPLYQRTVDYFEIVINDSEFSATAPRIIKAAEPYLNDYLAKRDGPRVNEVVDFSKFEVLAELRVNPMSVPIVTLRNKQYPFKSMRAGKPYTIISYCLENHPNEPIKIDDLKQRLKNNGKLPSGITNINEIMRKSLFGEGEILSDFIDASPQDIMVKTKVLITNKRADEIIEASKKSKSSHSE